MTAPVSCTLGALAANLASLAANTGTTPVTGLPGGVFVWDAQWTGTGTLALQVLGCDGATWREAATLAAPGTFSSAVRIGDASTVRLFNKNTAGGAAFTNVWGMLN